MNIIKNKHWFLSFSTILVAASIFGLFQYGLKQGIDYTGGSLWQLSISAETPVAREALLEFFKTDLGQPDAVVTTQSSGGFIVKTKELTEVQHQEFTEKLTKKFGAVTELSFDSIGSSIGQELTKKALSAFVINLIAISLYIAYAFRKVSHPVSSWKYALITLVTLAHDALIPLGLFAFLGQFMGVEIDINFIVAILVVIGFSVHDTIVVFDRIRENLRLSNNKSLDFAALVNQSVNETFARSLNTSLTLIIVLIALFILGAASLKYFILAILVGTVFGTYSSIFVASPLLVLWQKASSKRS